MAKQVQIDWLFSVMYRCTCMNTRTYGLRSPVCFSRGPFSAWRVQSIPRPAQSGVVHGNCRVASGVLGTSQRSGLWTHQTSWQLKEIRTFLLGEGELGLVTPCLGRYWLFLCLCLPGALVLCDTRILSHAKRVAGLTWGSEVVMHAMAECEWAARRLRGLRSVTCRCATLLGTAARSSQPTGARGFPVTPGSPWSLSLCTAWCLGKC